MKTKIILHGGFTRDNNELNDSYYQEITKNLKNKDIILVVLFSRQPEEYRELFKNETEKIKKSTDKNLSIILASENDFENQLEQSRAIIIRGGETDKLITTINKFPNFLKLIKGKVVGGSSAGAYLFAQYYNSASQKKVFKGLGILPIRVICHYKSKTHEGVGEEAIEMMDQYPKNFKLVILRDYEWKVFELSNL